MKINPKLIKADENMDLGRGYTARVTCEQDDYPETPWEREDGRGIVSEWTTRDKEPGEMVLATDRNQRRYFDFAGTVAKARADGWDTLPYNTGTKGERANRCAMKEYEFLRRWCNDEWRYIGVCVEVWYKGEAINENYHDALWGIESDGDYWQEVAADLIEGVIAHHIKARNQAAARQRIENRERRHWAARGVVTV